MNVLSVVSRIQIIYFSQILSQLFLYPRKDTYDIRQQPHLKVKENPKWWSSPVGFDDRAYFHADTGEPQNDRNLVDNLTVDRAMATDTGIYRCRVDFLKAPTRNSLVNLTVIVAPDKPIITLKRTNAFGQDIENYQKEPGNVIVIDEGIPSITLGCTVNGGWPRPRLTWYHENAVLDSSFHLLTDDYGRGYRNAQGNRPATTTTVNDLTLNNLTRWHHIMSQQHRTTGTARLTCQASNSITTVASTEFPRHSVGSGNRNLPPPATTEHTFIRLNLKPTGVQIVSLKEKNSRADYSETGREKYTIRADRTYLVECQSKGSRPSATIEWYLRRKTKEYKIVAQHQAGDFSSSSEPILEATIDGTVHTQQTPDVTADKDEMVVTTSVLSFMLRAPYSAEDHENDYNETTLVCRAYNPAIKIERTYVETKITLDVQYSPIVRLQFGTRLQSTGRIGPGDDVYFECVARANPSTTIRYSWYHNGVRLTEDSEKRRTEGSGEKKREKKNRLANNVIQYSQDNDLVLQSVKVAAAGKYTCQATNGIDDETVGNKTMSNTVRLYVKHVPVCQHREDVNIIMKMYDGPGGVPEIKCRAGRGHPPTFEYQWTFFPEPPADRDARHDGRLESDETAYGGRPARELDALLSGTAVQGGRDGVGTSYKFTTSTPLLKSYVSAVMAAASASFNGARPDFLRGRLECRAVNEMGVQNKPCVYRITDRININRGGKDVQEIVDCRSISRKDMLLNDGTNATGTYPCGTIMKDVNTNTVKKTRFCITCILNTSSSVSYRHRQQQPNYVLQLFRSKPTDESPAIARTFNVTGIPMVEGNPTGRTSVDEKEGDDDDYYFDPEVEESERDEDIKNDVGVDYHFDRENAVQRVVFVIDDSVEPGIYRGRIHNSNGNTAWAIVKGMINVAEVPFEDTNEGDYIIDEYDTDDSAAGHAWHRVTVALAEMFSVFAPSPAPSDRDGDGRLWRGHRRRPGGSAVITAVLIAVVVALSCGICAAIGILYRRGHSQRCEDDTGHDRGAVGGGDCGDGIAGGGVIGNGIGVGDGEKTAGVQPLPQSQKPGPVRLAAAAMEQRQTAADKHSGRRRPAEYAIPADENNGDDDDGDRNRAEAFAPLLQQQQQQQQLRRCRQNTGDGTAVLRPATDRPDDGCGGPDIVMSTSATVALDTGVYTDKPNGPNWLQPQRKRLQAQQTNFNEPAAGSHPWPSRRQQPHQRPGNATIHHPRSAAAAVSTTVTVGTPPSTATTAVVLTDKYNRANTKTIIDEPKPISSRELLNALHRESSI
ncbi:Immunoglobulin subtype,Immunoglobulin-like domain,Immunoglobulin-like fold,Immunoglobulin subtype 2 [Cinara cedri]|uniref:Immunoglobulin subtype,Immunoglobulin-like domain,Immunoglobulin-like fold,Immunoglobulin subtype 2 n=1 Tax=Cinara cedri TaxID=506608 RepID=A0A5E4N7Q4_9HEMI|nr:Immunoglobulin subtype,Immunoglobulin-like domain,Immunoglobulin-like fold,Immunoglobulin subtype 2 [Cinara cedri]